jgi:glycosyltransferase involved in cell wall biosynthesis
MDLSLVIPCYNESGNLPRLIERVAAVVPSDFSMEVIFVDNGSTDDSRRVFEDLLPRYPFAQLCRLDLNQGYGFGILSGLEAARGAVMGWTHADLQTDPADVVQAYRATQDALAAGRTVVKGRRLARPLFDRVFTAGMSFIASAALGDRFSDVNAQPKLFPRALMARFVDPPKDFSLDLYVLWMARRAGYAIVEYPVAFGDRTHGEAKGGGSWKVKWKLTRRTIGFIGALRRRIS